MDPVTSSSRIQVCEERLKRAQQRLRRKVVGTGGQSSRGCLSPGSRAGCLCIADLLTGMPHARHALSWIRLTLGVTLPERGRNRLSRTPSAPALSSEVGGVAAPAGVLAPALGPTVANRRRPRGVGLFMLRGCVCAHGCTGEVRGTFPRGHMRSALGSVFARIDELRRTLWQSTDD